MRRTLCALSLLLALSVAAPGQKSKTAPRTKDGRAAVNTSRKGTGAEAPRQLVEAVEIEGNRRLTDEEILSHVRVRPGGGYDPEQVQRDLKSLLDLGVFDTRQTRVTTTAGVRGGVVVAFFVAELPVIAGLKFEGLPKELTEEEVLKALGAEGIKVSKGDVYDPARIRRAKDVVRRLLAERGHRWTTVELFLEEVSTTTVSIKFVVSEGREF
ncbi:MAG TPA: POTRA domain-containing protein [Pyrinomonadaceae bacterium]|nr:POTRA domain-containing protein [Pyrinomonadaceae bacterium]